jgi:SAM-dependent methyltransferase
MSAPQLRHRKAAEFFGSNGFHPKNLLDVGCGNGTVTGKIRAVLGLGVVDGVDIQADRLEVPDWLRLVKADVDREKLPYPDDTFDAIYCGELLEHLYNPDNLLDEVYRVLTPEGVCLFTTPNLGSWYNRIVLLLGYQPCSLPTSFYHENVGKLVKPIGHRDHIRGFTLKALLELLRIHGFRMVKVMGWNQGVGEDYLSNRFISYAAHIVDVILSRVPSLAARLAVAVGKGS